MSNNKVDYFLEKNLVDYLKSVEFMEEKVNEIYKGNCNEFLWLLEHDNIYTAGTSAKSKDLLKPNKFKVHKTNRGGQFTYHGPGQKVVYLLLNIRKEGYDIRGFINLLEEWIIRSLNDIGIKAIADKDHIGIWVKKDSRKKKIAAIGLRIRKGITFHGISININPNLENFSGINPCGNDHKNVTSIEENLNTLNNENFDNILLKNFEITFKKKLNPIKTLI